MDKTVNARDYLRESAELGNAYDGRLDNVALAVLGNELCPGIIVGILSGEGNSLLLGIIGLDDNVDLVTP